MTKDLHAFFISNTFFQLSLSVAKFSNELNLKCWFNVAYYTKTLFNRNTLYCTSIYLRLTYVIYLSIIIVIFITINHNNLTEIKKSFFLNILIKSSASGCYLAFA